MKHYITINIKKNKKQKTKQKKQNKKKNNEDSALEGSAMYYSVEGMWAGGGGGVNA